MKEEDFDGYLKEIEEAQEKYGDKIKIYKSLEIEYFPEFIEKYNFLSTLFLLDINIYNLIISDLNNYILS